MFLILGGDAQRMLDQLGRTEFLSIAPPFLHAGETGVALFYGISGFLLYTPFVRARHEGRNLLVRSYLVRRAARIIPAYWLALVVIGLVTDNQQVFTAKGFVNYFLFMELFTTLDVGQLIAPAADGASRAAELNSLATISFNPVPVAWTLCVEVSFYLALPLWAWFAGRATRRSPRPVRLETLLLGGLIAFGLAWKVIVLSRVDAVNASEPWTLILPNSIDIFAVGMLLAVFAERSRRHGWPRPLEVLGRRQGIAWLCALTVFVALCAIETGWSLGSTNWLFKLDYPGMEHWRLGLWGWANVLIVALILVPVIVGSGLRSGVGRFLTSKPVAWVGLVSYGLYLWQMFVLNEVSDRLFDDGVTPLELVIPIAVLCYLLTLAIAAVSWYGLERHALRPAHRLPLHRRGD